MSGILASLFPRGTQLDIKSDDRNQLAVLTRLADNQGWSEEKFTTVLKKLAEEKKNDTTNSTTATASSATTSSGDNKLTDVEKRQETVRITRQADGEGWSDNKTLAALRLRNCVHYELREKARPAPRDLNEPDEFRVR